MAAKTIQLLSGATLQVSGAPVTRQLLDGVTLQPPDLSAPAPVAITAQPHDTLSKLRVL